MPFHKKNNKKFSLNFFGPIFPAFYLKTTKLVDKEKKIFSISEINLETVAEFSRQVWVRFLMAFQKTPRRDGGGRVTPVGSLIARRLCKTQPAHGRYSDPKTLRPGEPLELHLANHYCTTRWFWV
jgi:hypothetical protein